jgi:hypothetical protein
MTTPIPRRRQPWGAVLAAAPWDGVPVRPDPVRIPATAAAPVEVTSPPRPTTRRRTAFGALLAAAPWAGSDKVTRVAAAAVTVTDLESAEEFTTLEVVG